MKNLLENQVAIVTGGTSGIGRAIALKLASEGAKVVIIGTNQERAQSVAKEIRETSGNEALYFCCDVSKTSEVEEIVKKILEALGQVDILVNNAGINADQLLMKMTEEEWDKVIDINLKSCFNTSHCLVRPMMKARKGRIINISSVVGLMGNAGQVNYASAKAGMIGFTKALAKELASRDILVNCVAPGYIETPMTDKLNDKQKEAIISQIPMGRMGTPNDIADAVLFLASPMSRYMTGQVITVDGGMVM